MDDAERLLEAVHPDAYSIRLDCTAGWLRTNLERFSVCGVRLLDGSEAAREGYAHGSVVPTDPLPVEPEHFSLLAKFIATPGTPTGLCLGLTRVALDGEPLASIIEETGQPDFRPHYGGIYTLAGHRGRLVGLLPAEPGARTVTRIDRRITQYSERVVPGTLVGLHYDNMLTSSGEGERFPAAVRVDQADRRGLCNTGPGVRLLIVALNMTAPNLSERLSPGDGTHVPDTLQLRTLLRNDRSHASGIVCLVVRLDPGDMAVFPAGNALHDGSMMGCGAPSVAAVIAGRFPRLRHGESS